MKKALLTIYLVLFTVLIYAQSFEGEVIYQNTYKSKLPNVTDSQFNGMMGSIQNYWVKGGNYKSEANGSLMQWQLYVNTDNKLYNKLSNSETIFWNDGAVNDDTIISSELHKAAATILGYACDELVLTCKSGIQKYYFSTEIPVDTKLYTKHAFGNYYAYLVKANSIPLKIIVDNAQFTMESVATTVKPMKLDPAFFVLPAGVATAKSPY
ncbi:MAG: hypothetical protein ABIN91_17195 [Mucilaginibacter sp.]|uniref:hypothetical protein n=1 Tax=Mucilaginibacter sp. TaxID=1882438 RepID=UPI0032633233